MKKVFKSNRETISAFLNGATIGHNSNQSLIIDGNKLLSYGPHFVLATREKNGVWINRERFYFNEAEYSRTTTKQASQVISEAIKNKIDILP
jgi:hypothetical protein